MRKPRLCAIRPKRNAREAHQDLLLLAAQQDDRSDEPGMAKVGKDSSGFAVGTIEFYYESHMNQLGDDEAVLFGDAVRFQPVGYSQPI
jgi:hypothetical protein